MILVCIIPLFSVWHDDGLFPSMEGAFFLTAKKFESHASCAPGVEKLKLVFHTMQQRDITAMVGIPVHS